MSKKNKEKKKSFFNFKTIKTMFFLIVFCVLFASTAFYFLICMIPTIVAVIVDRSEVRTLGMTVGAMNLVGIMPGWLVILEDSQNIEMALKLALSPSTIVMSYGAAGIGWVLYLVVSRIVGVITLRKTEVELIKIDKKQKQLVEDWGSEVTIN